jgi:ATP-dependent DNA helicase DinG
MATAVTRHMAVVESSAQAGTELGPLCSVQRQLLPPSDSWGDFLRSCENALVLLTDWGRFRSLNAAIEDSGYAWPYPDRVLVFTDVQAWLEPIAGNLLPSNSATGPTAVLDTVVGLFQAILQCPSATRQLLLARAQPGTGWHRALSELQRVTVPAPAQSAYKTISGLTFLANTASPTRGDRRTCDGAGREEKAESQPASATEAGAHAVALLRQTLAAVPGIRAVERSGQLQMAHAVASALAGEHNSVIEAGTGIGKSFAYLVPALAAAQHSDKPVMVATHTLALSEQLIHKDIVALAEALPFPFTSAVQKGRTNYLCMRKLADELAAPALAETEDFFAALALWTVRTTTGDREELRLSRETSGHWQSVQSETASCVAKRCPFFRECFYFRARAKAATADVVVTNHSLVLADLQADHRVLPAYDALIIDEAHRFAAEATRQLGAHVALADLSYGLARLNARSGAIADLIRSAVHTRDEAGLLEALANHAVRLREAVGELAEAVQLVHAALDRGRERRSHASDVRITPDTWAQKPDVKTAVGALQSARDRVQTERSVLAELALVAEWEEHLAVRVEDVSGRVGAMIEGATTALDILLCRKSPDEHVCWIHWDDHKQTSAIVLTHAPIDVSNALATRLYIPRKAVVCTSATLQVNRSFAHFCATMGLSHPDVCDRLHTLRVESPFDYVAQTRLALVDDLPDPRAADFPPAVAAAVDEVAHLTGGRTLVLFTSYRLLQDVLEPLQAAAAKAGYRVLAQGAGTLSRSALVRAFMEPEPTVLLAVNSFWEGVDIPGAALTSLVIVRLPFAVPTHPIAQAQAQRVREQGGDPFLALSVPAAVTRLRQGFGRLIRTAQDRGVVFILDSRIVRARYGPIFLRSLPPAPVIRGGLHDVCAQARAFLA